MLRLKTHQNPTSEVDEQLFQVSERNLQRLAVQCIATNTPEAITTP